MASFKQKIQLFLQSIWLILLYFEIDNFQQKILENLHRKNYWTGLFYGVLVKKYELFLNNNDGVKRVISALFF